MKKLIIISIAVLFVIGGGAYAYQQWSKPEGSAKPAAKVENSKSMMDVAESLKDLQGDSFDRAFLRAMIDHHNGAIAMAQLVDTEATHPELRVMAQQIITAQTKEIKDMLAWANQWGYELDSTNQADIDSMTASLKGKTGEELDKQFIIDMIAHHEGAIQMVTYISGRAKHQEITDLGEDILTAQTMEIGTMQDWARDWGYDLGASGPSMPGHQMPM